jgi:glutamine synthetase
LYQFIWTPNTLKPRAIFRDPFRNENDILVMCDTYFADGIPLPSNTRAPANKIFDAGLEHDGLEYIMFTTQKRPLGFPNEGYPESQGPYYRSVGTENNVGREIVEEHYEKCLEAGVMICGINAEVCPGQWEFQVGPCEGIDMGDHLWVARYILARVAEKHGVVISYDPKPIIGDWNGSGSHTNYSTKEMREEGGYRTILAACEKLGSHIEEHMSYGIGNERRLTGKHEAQAMDRFTYGVADRGSYSSSNST